MLRSKRFFHSPRRRSALAAAVAPALLLLGSAAWAQPPETAVNFQAAIPVPVNAANTTGGMYSWDISYVDQTTQRLYISDRSNKAVDVINAKTNRFVTQFSATPAFAGASPISPELSGPNGVATARGCVIASDAGARLVSFTAAGHQVTSLTILPATPGRADEMAFDPKDNLLLVMIPDPNGSSNPPPPVAALINVAANCTLSVDKTITITNGTNGAEQPVWDPATQRFFVSLPQMGPDPILGALLQINPLTATIEAAYAVVACQPAGLALNPNNHTLLLGCSVVYDNMGGTWSGTDPNTASPVQLIYGTDGFIQAVIPGAGSSDEVWYNNFDDHFYTGSSGSPLAPSVVVPMATSVSQGAAIMYVIDGTSQRLDQNVPTFNVPKTASHPAGSAHSVAANGVTGDIYVPIAANNAYPGCLTGCVAVYSRQDIDTGAD